MPDAGHLAPAWSSNSLAWKFFLQVAKAERGFAVLVPGIDVGTPGEEEGDDVRAAVDGGVHQGGLAVGGPGIDRGAAARSSSTTWGWPSRAAAIEGVVPFCSRASTGAPGPRGAA